MWLCLHGLICPADGLAGSRSCLKSSKGMPASGLERGRHVRVVPLPREISSPAAGGIMEPHAGVILAMFPGCQPNTLSFSHEESKKFEFTNLECQLMEAVRGLRQCQRLCRYSFLLRSFLPQWCGLPAIDRCCPSVHVSVLNTPPVGC